MTTFPGPYPYFGPCDLVLAGHRHFVGDPPPGTEWICMQAGGTAGGAVVIASPLVVATYLVQLVHYRGTTQDVAVTTHHWRWEGSASPTAADFAAVETRMQAFWEAIKSYITVAVSSREYRWYGPRTSPGNWGEAIRVTPVTAAAGTATTGLPHQVACAVTETTDVRRRWGRFYIPNLATSTLTADSYGLFVATFTNAVGAAANTMLATDVGEFAPVVFGSVEPTSLPVRGLRVDRVPDIQRRRRYPATPGYSVTFT